MLKSGQGLGRAVTAAHALRIGLGVLPAPPGGVGVQDPPHVHFYGRVLTMPRFPFARLPLRGGIGLLSDGVEMRLVGSRSVPLMRGSGGGRGPICPRLCRGGIQGRGGGWQGLVNDFLSRSGFQLVEFGLTDDIDVFTFDPCFFLFLVFEAVFLEIYEAVINDLGQVLRHFNP